MAFLSASPAESLKGTSEITSSLRKKVQLLLAAHRNLQSLQLHLGISLVRGASVQVVGSLSEVASSLSLFLMQLSTHLPEQGIRAECPLWPAPGPSQVLDMLSWNQ